MKIAIPLSAGRFSPHFGGADAFALYTADPASRAVTGCEIAHPPAHEHGVFPAWLRSQGVTTVLAGGMGGRASGMLSSYGITVVTGATGGEPGALVDAFLAGRLETTGEVCGGGGFHDCGGHDHGPGHGHGGRG